MPVRWLGIAAALVVLFVVASWAKAIYVDYLWFESVDYEGNFRRVLSARISLLLAGTLIAGLVLGFNVWLARRLAPQGVEESFIEDVDATAIRRIVTVALGALTIFIAILFGGVAAGSWETILIWWNAVEFGVNDAAFGRDVSFYLFDLPAYHLIQGWVLSLLVLSVLGAGAVYGLTFSLQRFEVQLTRGMRIHLSMLGGLILLVIALGSYLGVFDLVTSPGGIVTGATFTDINARLPARYALIALGAFAGLVTIVNSLLSSSWRAPAFAVSLWVNRRHPRRLHLPLLRPVLPGRPQRAREGAALHRAQHRGHPPRLGPRRDRRDGIPGRAGGDRGRARRKPGDARQREAARPAADARHLQPDPVDPPAVPVRRRGCRSLRHRRESAAGHACAPGARSAARHADQRIIGLDAAAAAVHARLRRGGGAGQRDHQGGPAGPHHPRHPACRRGNPDLRGRRPYLLRRADRPLRDRQRERGRVRLPGG